ncbi:hypothetical protein [Arthrobacter sp. JSM 101049]|uniref:hypothetical protein n=1 Tax=Arthrobacter sp. JSM 101049 TaxID=929097 RepID=UPI00356B4AEA
MTTAQKFRGRRTATAAAIALLAVGMTGCSAVNLQATTMQYSASDGIVFNVADAQLRNMMLVTGAEGEPARLIGSIVNDTDKSISVELTVDGNSTTVDVPKKTSLKLEDDANKVVLPSAGAAPGSHVEATVTSGGNSVSESMPIVNGALPAYRPFIPSGYDESTVEHLQPTEPILEPEK